jgi:hypothetical protein
MESTSEKLQERLKIGEMNWATVLHVCNPSYSEAEIRKIAVGIQPGKIVCKTLS